MKSTEYPYYEDRELFEHSKSLNESRSVVAPSPSESEEDSFEAEGSDDKELFVDAEEEKDAAIKMVESNYEKQLADARSDFEKKLKEYQDQLATKDMDIIMLKVQLEDLEQKSEKIIDNVITKTQKHMQGEIKKYKKNHDQKVAKIISDAKEYFKQKNLESESEITKLKKEIEILTLKAEEINKDKDLEISKLKEEAEKDKVAALSKLKEEAEKDKIVALSKLKEEAKKDKIVALSKLKEEAKKDKIAAISKLKEEAHPEIEKVLLENKKVLSETEQKYKSLKEQNEQMVLIYDERVATLESEKEKSDDLIRRLKKNLELKEREISQDRSLEEKISALEAEKEKSDNLIRRLKKNLELKEREISHERSLEEKIIQFKQKLEEQDSLLLRKLENRLPPPPSEAKEDTLMQMPRLEKPKDSPEIEIKNQHFSESSLPKETPKMPSPAKEKVIPKQVAIEIQDVLHKERKKYEKLEGELNKNKQMIQQLIAEKKTLRRELEESKTIASPPEKFKPKPRVSLFDIISTILLIGANLLFIFVIYPNVAVSDWIESVGLNELSFIVRILLTLFGIMISLFCFVKAREASSKKGTSKQGKKEDHRFNFLMGVIVIGVVLLVIFLLSSNFLFFMTGTLLTLLAGLLGVIERKKISS